MDKTNRKILFSAAIIGHLLCIPDATAVISDKNINEDPEDFLDARGLTFKPSVYPPEFREEINRDKKLERIIKKSLPKITEIDNKFLKKIEKIALKEFGDDLGEDLIPYGLQFIEKHPIITEPDATVTASVSITWKDTDAGVDGDLS